MAKIHYKISLPFDLCRASGADKDAFDFIYDQRLLGLRTISKGGDVVVLGTDPSLTPLLDDIINAVAKGGSFEGVRVYGMLKENEFKDEVPVEFPDRMKTVDEVKIPKIWDEWLTDSGVTPHVSLDGTEKIFKLVYRGKYLNSDELASILTTSTVISLETYTEMRSSPEYLEPEG